MPYDCSYGRNGSSPRCQADRSMAPVAQKKHQMFAKRYFQEQGTGQYSQNVESISIVSGFF